MSQPQNLKQKPSLLSQLIALLKFRLTMLVVFSGGFGYFMASKGIPDWQGLILFSLGTFMVTGSANTINQYIERVYDSQMNRTKNRPLPSGGLVPSVALLYALFLGWGGTFLIGYFVSGYAAILGLVSLVLYAFVYTPLKRISPVSVFVGAFPGAFPPLIGWVAVSGQLDMGAFALFLIQFFWQFPHFWAIAWVAHQDYSNAGFKMLPTKGEPGANTAIQICVYTLFMVPAGLFPFWIGTVSIVAALVSVLMGAMMLYQSLILLKDCDRSSALRLMFGSFIYLPIVQIAFMIFKI